MSSRGVTDVKKDFIFTDSEWDQAKMFGQYEQRENREEVVWFRRVDLESYVSMIRDEIRERGVE